MASVVMHGAGWKFTCAGVGANQELKEAAQSLAKKVTGSTEKNADDVS
jgi:hypothetical protein